MTPKEKAEELVDKFYQTTPNEYFVNEPIGIKGRYKSWEQAKQCALIAVDEIMLSRKDDSQFDDTLWSGGSNMYTMHPMYLKYWQEVKQEIENL